MALECEWTGGGTRRGNWWLWLTIPINCDTCTNYLISQSEDTYKGHFSFLYLSIVSFALIILQITNDPCFLYLPLSWSFANLLSSIDALGALKTEEICQSTSKMTNWPRDRVQSPRLSYSDLCQQLMHASDIGQHRSLFSGNERLLFFTWAVEYIIELV